MERRSWSIAMIGHAAGATGPNAYGTVQLSVHTRSVSYLANTQSVPPPMSVLVQMALACSNHLFGWRMGNCCLLRCPVKPWRRQR